MDQIAVLNDALPPPADLAGDVEGQTANKKLKDAIVKAWNLPFSGVAHHHLYTIITTMGGSTEDFSNTLCVFQGSGSGKTRMVDEQGKLVFIIPFNFRSPKKEYQLAYPPTDEAVRAFFITSDLTEPRNYIRWHVFFSILFKHAKECVQNYREVYGLGYYEFLKHWKKVYLELVTRARREVENLIRETGSSHEILQNSRQSARRALQSLIAELDELEADDLPDTPRSPHLKVLVYFDEFQYLSTSKSRDPNIGSQKSLYNILLSVLNDYSDWPLLTIFVSAVSHVAPPAPAALVSSAHITEVSFDSSPELENFGPDILTRDQVSDVKFMANFGRPLFWTLFKALGSHSEGTILRLARAKLTARLAVLDARLCLDYGPELHHAVKYNTNEMVAKYMRLAFSVPEHYNKPILASILSDYLNDEGPLNFEELGDTVARVLLTDAYDRAVRKMSDTTREPRVRGTHCSVKLFLEALFTNSEEVLTAKPDNIPPHHHSSLSLDQLFERNDSDHALGQIRR
ncbi:hypothetical protein BDP27DRAFT_1430236 [Rhodocollybia butyracea]|uniref:Uncharacterized protein n=1 Tax=Rhodocollybia butyracea TaxID=206335 RepID=A0A9P5PBU8_9AGAR|nr:hypothetical protein BDP27DRAFT_1430236 [Rhodocollybia butyracea]